MTSTGPAQALFSGLGRGIVRHPWYPIIAWGLVLLVALPAVVSLGSVLNSGNYSTLPSSDMSIVAGNKMAAEFPDSSSAPSSTLVVLVHPDITGPTGQNATIAVAQSIASDPKVQYLGSVEDLYSAYGQYLTLDASIGLGALNASLTMAPSLPVSLNETSQLVWGPASAYVGTWVQVSQSLPSNASPSAANWPAFQATQTLLNASPAAEAVLSNFYYGYNASVPGFNQTVSPACLTARNVVPCADLSMRTTLPPLLPTLLPNVTEQGPALVVLTHLGIENQSSWPSIQAAGAVLLGSEVGLPASWMLDLWKAFPDGQATPTEEGAWALSLAETTPVRDYPVPIPRSLATNFVNAAGNATLIVVSFTQNDSYTYHGQTPVYNDVDEINVVGPRTLASNPAYAGIDFYQSGSAPLDEATMSLANSALSLLLVLTIVLLVVIMVVYFRAPLVPAVSFAAIGVALLVSLGGLYLIGRYVMSIDPILESIILVFLLAIGTDYSVFMAARYKEELVRHHDHGRAVASAVQWAGQSITTSGLTVIVVGLALSFSGIGLMEQLGLALSLSVVVLLLAGLTLIPAILALVGPKVFWPYTNERFRRHAAARKERLKQRRTYFSRAARFATRRPVFLLVLVVLLSAPITYVALNVPVSYDITNTGLPPSNPAQAGLIKLNQEFGPSLLSNSYVLVTFSQPLFPNGTMDSQEVQDVAALSASMNSTTGVAQVDTFVGTGGAPLPDWNNLSTALPAQQYALLALEHQYVGVDGRTVLFNVVTTSSGYSADAGTSLSAMQTRLSSFQSAHPEVSAVYYGGAAQSTKDFQNLANGAMDWMLFGASVGLFLVLLVLLGSLFVPPLALGAIGLSILWSWAMVYLVVGLIERVTLSFLLPVMLLVLILGLGMDYNALFLTRVKEERLRGYPSKKAIRRAVTHVGGVVTAAAVMLGGPFILLGLTSPLGLIAGLGLGIGMAVLMQALVAQTYVTPAILAIGKDRIWWGPGRKRLPPGEKGSPGEQPDAPSEKPASTES